jgi:phenylpyruvate tautomerase PptA (4-oxalocrotonate tautomerase family)
MPRYRVTGDVRHAFCHEVEAASPEEAAQIVEEMSHRSIDNVDTSNSATDIQVQDVEEMSSDEA